jgi:hypothetical protein
VHMKLSPGLLWPQAAFNKKNSFHQQFGLKFKEATSKELHLEYGFVGDDPWTLGKVDMQYHGNYEVRCWGRVDINWTARVRREELLRKFKEERTSCVQ